MSRLTRVVLALTVLVSVGLPDLASAQAKSRGGASARSGSSRGASVSRAPSRPAPSRKTSAAQPRTPKSSSAKTNPSGLQSGGSQQVAGTAASRDRNVRPAIGQAIARPAGVFPGPTFVFSRPTHLGLGFGLRYGSGFGYRPFGLGLGFGLGGRYGYYDPWGYGAYGYPGYGYGYRTYGYTGRNAASASELDDNPQDMGSVRLRMSPRTAKVYVDGALVGTVDDFDGLTGHLQLPAGSHQLEVRADGYGSYVTEILVTAGRTMTERAELKRGRQ